MADAPELLINKVFEAGDKIAAQLHQIAEQHGPQVVDSVLAVARITAAQSLVSSLFLVMLFPVMWWCRAPFVGWAERRSRGSDGFSWALIIIPSLVVACFSLTGAFHLFNLWSWAGLFYPRGVHRQEFPEVLTVGLH